MKLWYINTGPREIIEMVSEFSGYLNKAEAAL